MATNFRKFPDGGLGLIPRSSDPASPANGDIQFSDGTARAAGLWQYVSGAWIQLSAAADNDIARYTTNAGQSIPSAVTTIVNFEDSSISASQVTTGASWKYTADVTGNYQVSAMLLFVSSAAWGIGEAAHLMLYKNNVKYSTLKYDMLRNTPGSGVAVSVAGNDIIALTATDFIDIRINQNSGSSIALEADGEFNYVNIRRVL